MLAFILGLLGFHDVDPVRAPQLYHPEEESSAQTHLIQKACLRLKIVQMKN